MFNIQKVLKDLFFKLQVKIVSALVGDVLKEKDARIVSLQKAVVSLQKEREILFSQDGMWKRIVDLSNERSILQKRLVEVESLVAAHEETLRLKNEK